MKRKIISYFMIIILLTLSLVMFGFAIELKQYYYQGIANKFQNQVEAVTPAFAKELDLSDFSLVDFSDEIIKNYQVKGAELQLLKRGGELVQSSTGFYEHKTYSIDPSVLLFKTTYKTGENEYSGEKIMDVYTPIVFEGQVFGVLRYTISLTDVNTLIMNLLGYGMLVCTVVAFIVLFISFKLGNSIVMPLDDIINFTHEMSQNKYKERIRKIYPHEFGEMAKTLNDMQDEILRTDQLKNDFIASVSHELRTPLTGIKGWVETMQDPIGLSEEEFKFGLAIINDESERLISLVEDLLDFSRYQSNRIKFFKSSVYVDKLIRDVIFQLQKKAEQKRIGLIVETIPINIIADGGKLKQVVINILDNAIKFSYKNSTIHVIQSINQNAVLIEISDTGIGIREEDLAHIMESFYKIDPKSIGAGLGLAISRNIVEMHGGTIQIDSEYGKGTTVSISLPLKGSRLLD